MSTHYLKEVHERKLFLPNGAPVPFEAIDATYGLLSTSDPYVIGELEKAIQNHVGGVIKLTQEEFDSWHSKKNSPTSPLNISPSRDRESFGAMPASELQRLRSQGAAAVVGAVDAAGNVVPHMNQPVAGPGHAQQQARSQKVAPLEVPQSFSVPRVGKPSAAKKAVAPPLGHGKSA